jgi:hypothetical protein
MSERCIVAARFTPAGPMSGVRKAVGGFLRYVQHRDFHSSELAKASNPQVSGLLKYVAYRDRASARAELFGPTGTMGSDERKAFAAFVVRSLEDSRPQPCRARNGELVERRRAVYRLVISPERAQGLDLRRLTSAAVERLESEMGVDGLRWMAAIHRNTRHPHVHLVLAGMRETADGFARVDLTKPRLAAIKEAVGLEIQRQRTERTQVRPEPMASEVKGGDTSFAPALKSPAVPPALIRTPPLRSLASPAKEPSARRGAHALQSFGWSPVLRLRAAARRYQRQMQHATEEETRRLSHERAA